METSYHKKTSPHPSSKYAKPYPPSYRAKKRSCEHYEITQSESLGMSGNFWAREYCDKVLRDEKQVDKTIHYILSNPIKANLIDAKERVFHNTDFRW